MGLLDPRDAYHICWGAHHQSIFPTKRLSEMDGGWSCLKPAILSTGDPLRLLQLVHPESVFNMYWPRVKPPSNFKHMKLSSYPFDIIIIGSRTQNTWNTVLPISMANLEATKIHDTRNYVGMETCLAHSYLIFSNTSRSALNQCLGHSWELTLMLPEVTVKPWFFWLMVEDVSPDKG